MKREEFALALNALLPGCDPEAVSGWAAFANERVESGQFVHSIPVEHDAAAERWLDAIFVGLCTVKQEYGLEIAAKVAELSCQQCALYPREMLSAARVLGNGGGAERINAMITSGGLEAEELFFFDLPDGAALTRQGPEIGITQSGVPCGLFQKRIEAGYMLADGTVLLESERDSFGRYRGGAGMDGVFLQTGKLYAPIRGADGQPRAFQEVKPVTAQDREAAFLAGQGDALAIYRPIFTPAPKGFVSLAQMQESGDSPLKGNYDLIHIAPLTLGADPNQTMEAYRAAAAMKPGDIAAFKQAGMVTCWYMDQLANSKLPGLLAGHMNTAPSQDVEEVIARMRAETIWEIGKKDITVGAQVAWYWTYIGALDMAQQLGLIDDARRQALYREAEQFKPAYEVRLKNPLAAVEMSTEGNYNQIDGLANNEAPKPSVLDTLRQNQAEAARQTGAPPGKGKDRGR